MDLDGGPYLNPRFVEQMMGFPTGWSALEDSETQSCPNKFSRSCEESPKLSEVSEDE
jgi:hypothetical protein